MRQLFRKNKINHMRTQNNNLYSLLQQVRVCLCIFKNFRGVNVNISYPMGTTINLLLIWHNLRAVSEASHVTQKDMDIPKRHES